VALDFKAMPEKEIAITGGRFLEEFSASLDLLLSFDIPFEIRTTVHQSLLTSADILAMSGFLNQKSYKGVYYLQNFKSGVPTLGNIKSNSASLDPAALESSLIPIVIRN